MSPENGMNTQRQGDVRPYRRQDAIDLFGKDYCKFYIKKHFRQIDEIEIVDNNDNLLINYDSSDPIYSLIPSKFGYKLFFIRNIHVRDESSYLSEVLIPALFGYKAQATTREDGVYKEIVPLDDFKSDESMKGIGL